MPRFVFSKLVRDDIVDHQITSGARPSFRMLTSTEHKEALIKKIIEEIDEVRQAEPQEVSAEIADVQQAIDDLVALYGLTASDIKKEQNRKNTKNGTFKKGVYIEYIDIDEDDTWTSYYRTQPDRYPEID